MSGGRGGRWLLLGGGRKAGGVDSPLPGWPACGSSKGPARPFLTENIKRQHRPEETRVDSSGPQALCCRANTCPPSAPCVADSRAKGSPSQRAPERLERSEVAA